MAQRSDDFRGIDITSPVNRIPPGRVAMSKNVRSYGDGRFQIRNTLSAPIITIDSSVQSLARMNDTTPAGPMSGYVLISESSAGDLYAGPAKVASGLSGNSISIVPFRPATSVQPWAYIGDSAPSPNVTVDSSFNCAGMIKVRSDGLSRKTGIKEPQSAPTVSFPGGGSGPSLIYYYYVYRASETGAQSNPSPVSIPGTNSQSNPSSTISATSYATNFTFNALQYEYVAPQLRTTGGTAPGTITDFVIVHGLGFAIPSGVSIDGIQVDLNWIGQNSGTGVLSSVALYYLGSQLGTAKFPGIQNQSFSTDTLQGGNADTWGASLSPSVVNDNSFGFGVQITTQSSGGSDRSFINSMGITVYYSTQDALISPTPSTDPQVDKIDIYRQGNGLANPTYVGTSQNTSTPFNDILSDLAVASNPTLEFDNFEPFPSIDLPRKGTLNATSNVLTFTGGDPFNIRWLPGTVLLIGTTSQVAYSAVRRPASALSWDFTNNDPNVPSIPNGTNLAWNIAEPILAAQPLPYLFGPTDNINYVFGVGDPLRPGTMYWCKGNNFDSAPDTNQLEVTDPSEVLVNGAMSNGLGVVFSIRRAWIILPNFFNALATVTGTQGSTWTLQATGINRGLYIPRCLVVDGGGSIFFRVEDGIDVSRGGGASVSITNDTLYQLFVHEGSTPTAVTRNGITLVPPDDTQPNLQKFSLQGNYLYYDYIGIDQNPHTLVYDILLGGWCLDSYAFPVTIHASNEGESQQGTLVGCNDGTIRSFVQSGVESITGSVLTPAIGGTGWMHAYEYTVEYLSQTSVTLTSIAADANNGSYAPNPVTLPSTGGQITKFTFKISANKWKLMWFQFDSSDPHMQVFLEGFAVSAKPWGSKGPFKPITPFRSSGGLGGQA
ncbi:MAG: hypothetical protein KGL39_19200 [Patescibacteria group bacterium]|nr:hypothetical protein [Patescibacteria group bacterium]